MIALDEMALELFLLYSFVLPNTFTKDTTLKVYNTVGKENKENAYVNIVYKTLTSDIKVRYDTYAQYWPQVVDEYSS